MSHAKDFDHAEDVYSFYRQHTDQTARSVEALRVHLPVPRPRSVLDFGCGEGRLLEGLLDGWTPACIWLVDPAEARFQAEAALRARGVAEVCASPNLAGLPEGQVELMLANQVLFYVEDVRATLLALWERLAPGGRLLIAQAGSEKCTTRLRDEFFASRGVTNPYNRAEDVERALEGLGFPFQRSRIESTLTFPDTPSNRRSLLRFLFGESFEPEAQGLLDQFRAGETITLPNVDRLLRLDKPL